MPKAPSASSKMTSSPRPRANPRNSGSNSATVNSSPRPQSRPASVTEPASAPAKSQSFNSVRAAGGNADNQGQGKTKATTSRPGTAQGNPIIPTPPPNGGSPITGAPNNPNSNNNPNLPADAVQAARGERRPDRSLLDALRQPGASRSAQKYRGTVLSSVYKLPADPAKSAKTLQQFNGPRGQRMTLGA